MELHSQLGGLSAVVIVEFPVQTTLLVENFVRFIAVSKIDNQNTVFIKSPRSVNDEIIANNCKSWNRSLKCITKPKVFFVIAKSSYIVLHSSGKVFYTVVDSSLKYLMSKISKSGPAAALSTSSQKFV
jgi:hypothetical protein